MHFLIKFFSFCNKINKLFFFSIFYNVEEMANRTAKDAATVKGTNPQYLIEKIIRTRIYDSMFWKEKCFGLSGKNFLSRFFVHY